MIKKIIRNEQEMLAFANQLAHGVEESLIIFLIGPLGAGKTTFARGFLQGLGYKGKVKSPTYTLVEPYQVATRQIYHFDFYRIERLEELDEMGLRDYFSGDVICLIEWPEKAEGKLPGADLICKFTVLEDGREIELEVLSLRGELL